MKKLAIAGCLSVLLCASPALRAAEMPQMPKPVKEHRWLNQFVGDWVAESTIPMEPGKPPMKVKSTETFSSLGGFWVVGRGNCKAMGMNMSTMLTIGYDTAKKKYVGTWVDSNSGYLWNYVGSVDKTGKRLTLMTTGYCAMLQPGKLYQFKEVTEFRSPDHRVFTSSMLNKGKWTTMVTTHSRRKK